MALPKTQGYRASGVREAPGFANQNSDHSPRFGGGNRIAVGEVTVVDCGRERVYWQP
ncbi:hypothetical protein M407DRAFT_151786 [Tulasnella calospora MUT 4182]|uniref:Uncharacterized protein n=1 Tax=Tulasnella calospora MUT 4182 TaxID=1051891 RepID=A0A0C3MKI4_9AGAM|nr:hypothetical protein M407DRAFT_151786 [Tulasnella calospora MUT 4182]